MNDKYRNSFCLPPCNKKNVKNVIKKVIPLSTSNKRECITTWWDIICNKVHQHQVIKHRNKMHKNLEKQLDFLRQDINQTATTSITQDDDEVTTITYNRVPIGICFNDFYSKTIKQQAIALATCNINICKDKKIDQEQEEKKIQGKQRFEIQQRNFDNFVKNQQQKLQQDERQRKYTTTYKAELAPLEEDQVLSEKVEIPQTTITAKEHNKSSTDQSILSIPERVPGPIPQTVDQDRFLTDLEFRSNSDSPYSQQNETPDSMKAIYGRSVDYSLSDSYSSAISSRIQTTTDDESQQQQTATFTISALSTTPITTALTTATAANITININNASAHGEIEPVFPNENIQQSSNRRYFNEPIPRKIETIKRPGYKVAKIIKEQYIQYYQEQSRINFILEIRDMVKGKRFKINKSFLQKYIYIDNDEEVIGDGINGGVRAVYKFSDYYTDLAHTPQFAVKKIRVDPTSSRQFKQAILNEIYIMNQARFQPNLMCFTDLYYYDNTITIIMNRMTCDVLDLMNIFGKPLPQSLATHILGKVVDGLYYLHYELNYFHGDIKPENILLSTDGQVKITDFGFSSPIGIICRGRRGTEGYMAPEVYNNEEFNEKSDLWSLGMMIICMLNFGLPEIDYDDFFSTTIFNHLNVILTMMDTKVITSFLRYILYACLLMDPSDRYSIAQLQNYLATFNNMYHDSNTFQLQLYIRRYIFRQGQRNLEQ